MFSEHDYSFYTGAGDPRMQLLDNASIVSSEYGLPLPLPLPLPLQPQLPLPALPPPEASALQSQLEKRKQEGVFPVL